MTDASDPRAWASLLFFSSPAPVRSEALPFLEAVLRRRPDPRDHDGESFQLEQRSRVATVP
eukprot:6551763-Pyramimonas_sp.AAC.1